MAAMVVLGDMLNVAADGEQGTDGQLTFLAFQRYLNRPQATIRRLMA